MYEPYSALPDFIMAHTAPRLGPQPFFEEIQQKVLAYRGLTDKANKVYLFMLLFTLLLWRSNKSTHFSVLTVFSFLFFFPFLLPFPFPFPIRFVLVY